MIPISLVAVTPLYAAVLGLLFLLLSVRVIAGRRSRRLRFGTGGDPGMERRIRIHANFAEYVPLALILLFKAESLGAAALWLHLLCGSLVAGRLAHAILLSFESTDDLGRILGMTGSQVAILGGAILIIMELLA
jgi:uncharacterized membrane protein YecN with MAPEG domain